MTDEKVQEKHTYYVKSGDGYLMYFENGGIPVMSNSKKIAMKFADLELAKIGAKKLAEMGMAVAIEVDDVLVLEE